MLNTTPGYPTNRRKIYDQYNSTKGDTIKITKANDRYILITDAGYASTRIELTNAVKADFGFQR